MKEITIITFEKNYRSYYQGLSDAGQYIFDLRYLCRPEDVMLSYLAGWAEAIAAKCISKKDLKLISDCMKDFTASESKQNNEE